MTIARTGADAPAPLGLDPELVERTRGAQPFRRVFHACNGVLLFLVLEWFAIPTRTAVVALAVVFVVLLAVDVVRLRLPRANALFFTAFAHLASPREAGGVASSTWYTLGVVLALAVFPRSYALSGILVLALADPAASYVGQRWGRRPFLGGSVEGMVVFFAVASAVLLLHHSPGMAFGAAGLATIAERRSWPLDDNFTIAPATAAALLVLEMLT